MEINFTLEIIMTTIYGTTNNDYLVGTSGDDTIYAGLGQDILRGGLGADVLDGGAGLDRADYRDSSAGIVIKYDAGTSSNATGTGAGSTADGDTLISIEAIIGSNYNDHVTGNAGDNIFFKVGGQDTFTGGGGIDKIDFEIATAATMGQGVVVSLDGYVSSFVSFTTADIHQWQANSRSFIQANNNTDPFDTIIRISDVDGTQNADWIVGSNQISNTINGLGGNDHIYGLSGDDSLLGGAGNDMMDGGWDDDILRGQVGNDRLYGGLGNDNIYGDADGDIIDGGNGEDRLRGGDGDDVIGGGDDSNTDYLWGNHGADVFVFADGIGSDRILDFENGFDVLDFSDNSAFNNFADVSAGMTQSGSHVRLQVDAQNVVFIYNTDLADIDAGDFVFL